MWPAVVASWLMVMSSGQLELNAPQNAANQPETVIQPSWKPAADETADRPAADAAPAASNLRPVIRDYQPPAQNPSPSQYNAADSGAGPSSALPKPFLTRQTYFSIPARSEAAAQNNGQNNSQIVEVQMFVSHDRGANWNFYTRVKPDQSRIPFRTAADGEYWFAARTLDRAGKFQPQTVTSPALIVVIDTKPPTVLLSAESGPGGQITARWEIYDPHLKPDSLSLQYRTSTNGPWQPVAVSDKDLTNAETTQSGEVTWWPTPGTQEVIVRAEVSDTVGNKAVGHAQVKLGPGGNTSSDSPKEAVKKDSPLPLGDIKNASPLPTNPRSANGEGPGARAVTAGSNPKIGNKYPSDVASALLNNPFLAYLPPNEKPRMVNSRVFELDYDLQAVGPSGVSRVELFGTRDGGRTWRSYGIDSDNRSPMSVRVDEEGMYGFRIVVTSGAGLGDPPPKSGDKPSIWVGVDLTRPTAKINSAEFGTGNNEDKLVITWEASDKMLAEKPVTLYYSSQPGGQFTPFASNLENSGRYVWSLDGSIPPLVYLRLEVADEAGNHTFYDHPQPIPLDRSRPTGQIRNVRPAG
jgi:hypothetical protein